ncbi:hypothetical protein DENIS_1359 [Desulfonema ishimotonii]|uniref:Uncharacterized protein n=1 Tax=Desulfonema ishimotonii TaxID=45657 RepID=A0A401FTU7_9BACT|nr:hypothetical protein [Desulfonema ishimotonii]GBC60407.1 hypothetical protein DENIS_1359 [Desulfonema ishimotonii]
MARQTGGMLYTFFYLLFSVWLWQALYGIGLGLGMGFGIGTQGMGKGGAIVLWMMVMGCGWWLARYPALWTTRLLKKVLIRR